MDERLQAADVDGKARCVVRAWVDKLKTERASLAAGVKHTKTECETLLNCICKLEVVAATGNRELGVVVRAVRSLKERVMPGETSASMAEV